jgi:uncharacterized membrane protein
MRLKDQVIDILPWAIAMFLIAAIVHIVSVLLMPAVAPRDAYARLLEASKNAKAAPGGVLPLQAAGTSVAGPLPFEDPATSEGACLFNLSNGLLHVRASVDNEEDNYLGVSFHTAGGAIFHAMTDRASIKGKIDVIVGNARQIDEIEADDDQEAPPEQIRLTAPSQRGFVLIRSLAKRPSDFERSRSSVEAVSCETIQPPAQ